MKYTPLILKKIQELSNQFPEYSFGDLLYTILREKYVGEVQDRKSSGWIREVSDQKFYTAVENAIKKEDNYE